MRAYANEKMDYVLEAFDRYEREEREDALNEDVLAHFADQFNDEAKKTKFILDSLYYLKKRKSVQRSWTTAYVPTEENLPKFVLFGAK